MRILAFLALIATLIMVARVSAQDLNAIIQDAPQAPAAPIVPVPIVPDPTDAQASTEAQPAQDSDKEAFTLGNRCPRCALYAVVQYAEQGYSCQDVVFHAAPSFGQSAALETQDTLDIDTNSACRLSFFNDSPDKALVLKLDRSLMNWILTPSSDLYSGFLLAPKSEIDVLIRSGLQQRPAVGQSLVTWADAQSIGPENETRFTIRIGPKEE